MSASLDPQYFFNSRQHPAPGDAYRGGWIDLAQDPSAAHRLIKLGISPRTDLPALTLTDAGGKVRLLALRLTPEEASHLAAGETLPAGEPTLFGAAWCPDTRKVRKLFEGIGRSYREVNVDLDAQAEALVFARSGGRRVTPTLLFDERLWLFNPAADLLERFAGVAAGAPGGTPAGPRPASRNGV